jgi:hypothetical protein
VQVKTVQHVNRGAKHGRPRPVLDIAWAGRGKSYYAANGVQAFAVWTGRGFYVIPVDVSAGERRIRVGRRRRFWEAWGRVLGERCSVKMARRALRTLPSPTQPP